MKKVFLFVVILTSILLSIACDPGIEYNPSGWQRKGNYNFTNNYNGFDLELRGFNGLIGGTNYILEGEIYNQEKTAKKFYVEKAILKANGKEYIGEPSYKYENEIKTIKVKEAQPFGIYWDFKKPLYEVLKDPVELNLTVKNGEQSNEISIPMVDSSELEKNK